MCLQNPLKEIVIKIFVAASGACVVLGSLCQARPVRETEEFPPRLEVSPSHQNPTPNPNLVTNYPHSFRDSLERPRLHTLLQRSSF